jgi:hypothetical protein
MRWLVVIKNIESGRLEIITPTTKFDHDAPHYDNTVHIVPFKEEPDPQRLSFGVHELAYNCACHPKIQEQCGSQTIITHRVEVN